MGAQAREDLRANAVASGSEAVSTSDEAVGAPAAQPQEALGSVASALASGSSRTAPPATGAESCATSAPIDEVAGSQARQGEAANSVDAASVKEATGTTEAEAQNGEQGKIPAAISAATSAAHLTGVDTQASPGTSDSREATVTPAT